MRIGLIALVLALVLSACSLGSQQESGAGFVDGDGSVDFAEEDRSPAPDVVGMTLDEDNLALADLEGPVVINFWASWCGPCAAEASDLVAVAERYADQGVHVVGVNVKDSATNARSFERDFGIPYPSWHDESASIAARFGGIGPSALPTTIILDAEHRVASRLFGAVSETQLAPRLDALLADAAASTGEPG